MPSFAISKFTVLLEPLWVSAEFLLLSTGPLLYIIQFTDIGLTPLKVVKQIFGGKDRYFKCLNEIENKLYEE